ncbi:hypothetical protein BK130_18325 [Viridibacillus sp. FSL H8-0123]|uniref:Uncharacterized protein n=1 Tax=Viridibacillus arenosi FSL R5-213 TaxID=1227360 RepID=W4ELP2_9BACL|nr:hypothetical protein C176_18532 [Viridibacillus arenosi FSL R5-213]OMC80036.1 hypothetical protein BK130_18325 [Viridibacillus sp. FSL H8-0123]OMC84316.1 hypothetical protein BK128_17225 [Viridibacillus sp. FSL H7-0596]OMC89683.1 hypothetical protein BK137_16535 [Viridibacillus arenosi]
MNFAYFLAENRVYTAVLEGLSDQPVLKNWLKRYTSVPTSWKSYCRGRDTRNMYFMKSIGLSFNVSRLFIKVLLITLGFDFQFPSLLIWDKNI